MQMTYFYCTVLLGIVIGVFTSIHCVIISNEYRYRTKLDDSVCTDSQKLFEESVRSKVECLHLCTKSHACFGVFYDRSVLTCTMCTGYNHVVDQTGTIFMMKQDWSSQLISSGSEVYCGLPSSHDRMNLGHVYGSYLQGYQLTYTCTPCTFFPAGAGVITCQGDGTWTTPICVSGPDVGMLRDGQLIPDGSLGCFSTYSTRCRSSSSVSNGLGANGEIRECWCDSVCCSNGDCCFDADC